MEDQMQEASKLGVTATQLGVHNTADIQQGHCQLYSRWVLPSSSCRLISITVAGSPDWYFVQNRNVELMWSGWFKPGIKHLAVKWQTASNWLSICPPSPSKRAEEPMVAAKLRKNTTWCTADLKGSFYSKWNTTILIFRWLHTNENLLKNIIFNFWHDLQMDNLKSSRWTFNDIFHLSIFKPVCLFSCNFTQSGSYLLTSTARQIRSKDLCVCPWGCATPN